MGQLIWQKGQAVERCMDAGAEISSIVLEFENSFQTLNVKQCDMYHGQQIAVLFHFTDLVLRILLHRRQIT